MTHELPADVGEARRLLRTHPILRQADAGALGRLAQGCEVRHLPAGASVLTVGTPFTHLLLIATGGLELRRSDRHAKTQMLQGVIEAPALFGEVELYARAKVWVVSARAFAPVTLVRLPPDAWEAFVGARVETAAALYREACARHMLSIQLMQIFALQRTENKILRLLAGIAEQRGDGQPWVARVSQTELARALALNPKTIARKLAELESAGVIRRVDDGLELQVDDPRSTWAPLGPFGAGTSWRLPRE